MKCSLLPQFLILMALGLGAGFVHSKLSPVRTTLDKPASPKDAMSNAPKRDHPPGAMRAPAGADGSKPEAPAQPAAADGASVSPGDKTGDAPAKPGVTTDAPPGKGPVATPTPGAGSGDETLTPALREKGHISLAEGYELFTSNTAYFVDTRKRAEYEEGHIQYAFGIPLAAFHGKNPKLVDAIPREAPVVCYCLGGNCDESEEVAKNLNQMGYKNVYVLHAGFPGWKNAGYPIEVGPGIQEEE
ncbi:MAG: rhodanese-like domain-containing protein [Phycisphaerales bacterium]